MSFILNRCLKSSCLSDGDDVTHNIMIYDSCVENDEVDMKLCETSISFNC